QRLALRVPRQTCRPDQDCLVGRHGPLPLRQAVGKGSVLLAADRQQPGPVEPCSTAVAGGGHGLETGALGAGGPPAIGWIKSLRQTDSQAQKLRLSGAFCAMMRAWFRPIRSSFPMTLTPSRR